MIRSRWRGRDQLKAGGAVCDYCGCRSEPPLAELGQEHEEFRWHLAELSGALGRREVEEAKSILNHLFEHLRPHIDKEERGLFTQLRSESELDEEVASLSTQHEDLSRLIEDLPSDEQEWIAAVRKLMAVLHEHIDTEEYDLFPAAFQVLSNDGWIAVRKVHHDER